MAYSKLCKYCEVVTLEGYNPTERRYYEQGTQQLHTIDRCNEAKKRKNSLGTSSNHQPQQVSTIVRQPTDQDQRAKDIKDAQIQRKAEHDELIKYMKLNIQHLQYNTKMLANVFEANGAGSAEDVLADIGFREYQEEQRTQTQDV